MSTANFKSWDDLIHRRSRRIYLNSDIVLDKDEISGHRHGIKIDRDNIEIMGNGHTIDAYSIARILYKIFSIFNSHYTVFDSIGLYIFQICPNLAKG